ncbi:ParB N-terminal domain-containing protein [Pseudomonas aeruginosa]|nr:ParB N-terminal domain-containing protein [Pseudomonas aeruginosa]
MTAAEQKIATSFRAFEEQQSGLRKAGDATAVQVGRGRIHSVRALDIKVYPERNIRPIDRKTVESYKQKFRDGLTPPAVDAKMEEGRITLVHGYHRTIAAQELATEDPETFGDLMLDLREFRGNSADAIFLMFDAQDSLAVDPVARADGYFRLSNQLKLSLSQIAERLPMINGKRPSAEHVRITLFLVKAEEEVKQAIREDRIAASTVIDLIKEEEQGGRNHVEVVREMLTNAEAVGKTKASNKHRTPAAPRASSAPRLKMREVSTALTSLRGVSSTIRDSLKAAKVEDGASEVMVPVNLPASKLIELLDLLDKAAPVEPETKDENQTDMFQEGKGKGKGSK